MARVLRIGFLGSNYYGFSAFKRLLAHGDVEPVFVVGLREDRFAASGMCPYYYQGSRYFSYGLSRGIPSFLTQDLNTDPELLRRLRELRADFVFAMGWPDILRDDALRIAPGGCVGVHPSTLPLYRGGAPLNWQIIEGSTEIGVSAFLFAERLDAGAVIVQRRYARPPEMSAAAFVEDVYEDATLEVMEEALRRLAAGARGTPIDPAQGSYRRRRTPDQGRIDLKAGAAQVRDFVLAQCYPFPGAFIEHREHRLTINGAEILDAAGAGDVGEVLAVSPDGFDVRVENGAVRFTGVVIAPVAPLDAVVRPREVLGA